jgi:outer membrane lipoprotein-sorting protein
MRDRAKLCSAAALAALFLTGCPSARPPASQFPDADAALGRMHATYACVNGVQGTAKIDHFSKRGRIRGDVYILAVNPARVRFDVVSPFGANLYTLTSNGTTFQMLDVTEKQFLHGPASACNLARLTQVPIPGHALVSLLRGEAPVLTHTPESASIAWDDEGFYKVLLRGTRDANEEIHLGVHPADLQKPWSEQRVRVLDVRVAQRGIDLYHAELRNHEAIKTAGPRLDPDGIDDPVPPIGGACSAEVPRSIRMRVPHTEDDVIFQYKEARWNPPVIQGSFRQPVPGGVVQQYTECRD